MVGLGLPNYVGTIQHNWGISTLVLMVTMAVVMTPMFLALDLIGLEVQ